MPQAEDTSVTPAREQTLPAEDMYCPECGYNLRGLTSGRCPECGLLLDFIDAPTSFIPWVQRKERGRIRAYVLTVLLAIFRNRLFCREIFRPMSYIDAQRFRWTTVLLVMLVLGPVMLGHLMRHPKVRSLTRTPSGFVTEVRDADWSLEAKLVGGPAATIGLLLFLLVLTGIPSYFFHPRHLSTEQQNRTLALSYYAGAALILAPIAVGIIHLWQLSTGRGYGLTDSLAVADGLAVLLALLLYWLTLVRMASRSLHHHAVIIRAGIAIPLLWIVIGGLTLVGVPLLLLYVGLILSSVL